ncbi:MAG: hypothetical protein ABIJ61_02250 [bacterium]
MDAWSVAQLGLDLLFAVVVALAIAGFIYRRELKLRRELVAVLGETALSVGAEKSAVADTEKAPPSATERANRYLEAVRLYRGGRNRDEIENKLGISLSEMELLSKVQ